MDKVRELCKKQLGKELYQIIISNPKGKKEITKVKIRPTIIKEELLYQISEWKNNQIFHKNMDKEQTVEKVAEYLEQDFSQMELTSKTVQATILVSKKGKVTLKEKQITAGKEIDLSHNKIKKYILQEGTPVPFLIDLGVQTREGKIVKSHYDKFRQINRYLEFIQDIMPILPKDRTINIIDFGCGKSYLTFITGDVSTYTGEAVDMVVTLHACDTATDYALMKAIDWKAKVIFIVPCCQHEVNKQIRCEELAPLLKYGLIKERISALLTDAVRANLLEEQGYQVQVMEFIDMEHTPKNILIRAVLDEKERESKIDKVTDYFNVNTTLQKLLSDRGRE